MDILYRYNPTCTGTTCLKINSGEIVPVQLKLIPVQLHENCGICPRTRSVREGTLVNEPKWENHIGGGYKRKRTQVIESFCTSRVRFGKNKSFSPFFELDLVDPDFRLLLF